LEVLTPPFQLPPVVPQVSTMKLYWMEITMKICFYRLP